MSEREHQEQFLLHVCDLVRHIHATPGYSCTGGDLFRDPRLHGKWGEKVSYSAADSYHKRRLAIDLNLFYQGMYLGRTGDHEEFGAYWEALDPLNRWGGRFKDGNHYERVPEGWREEE